MKKTSRALPVVIIIGCLIVSAIGALANGGPFIVRHPSGDPAAKGIMARLDPDLKPRRETRLRVVKEDLTVNLDNDRYGGNHEQPPLADVTAAYTIENPTGKKIDVDFGFPVMRGMYISPVAMAPIPHVQVRLGEQYLNCTIIGSSAIYGVIRQKARKTIHDGIVANKTLLALTTAVRKSEGAERDKARTALARHLTGKMKWNNRDAALLVEYTSIEMDEPNRNIHGGVWNWSSDKSVRELMKSNLGPVAAIGDQKATQFLAQLASRFDPKAASTYESIFEAWGGDVRERSLDLKTGKLRPREVEIDRDAPSGPGMISDPTVYARVDYLDSSSGITDAEKASCKAILKNLPVIFTFAPMNLLHYRVSFPAKSKQILTVNYKQYCFADTRSPDSYQLAYVLHPASLWKSFGPIKLMVTAPWGVDVMGSVKCVRTGSQERPSPAGQRGTRRYAIYRATVKSHKGEMFLALSSADWKKALQQPARAEGGVGDAQQAVASQIP